MMKEARRGKKNRKTKNQNYERRPWHADVDPDVKKTVAALFFFTLAVLFALSFSGRGGSAGAFLARTFDLLLGRGYFLAPVTLVLLSASMLLSEQKSFVKLSLVGAGLFLMSLLAAFHIMFGSGRGGLIGALAGAPLVRLFDYWASLVIITGGLAASVLLLLNVPFWKRKESGEAPENAPRGDAFPEENERTFAPEAAGLQGAFAPEAHAAPEAPASSPASVSPPASSVRIAEEAGIALRRVAKQFNYQKPPVELMQDDRGAPSSGDIKANSNIIKRTLQNFGIDVDMAEVSIGPTLTQYTLKPAEGIKLARIVALHDDLALALAAHPIRIEAPIPGKSLVGIEVPNRSIALVGLRALIEQKPFQEFSQPLLFALGRDVAGAPVYADLAKMPHLLVSGSTGSGKSVAMHAMLMSFLYRNPPQILRFIIVDPKRVELSVYNDIPHLLTPVITDPKTTVQSLRWATREMDRRYELLSLHQARDIASYNAHASKSEDAEFLPYIVIVIDELADLMATFPREVESAIIRLAQMARAVGIHLVVATQRPSVEVITGLIKANITSRIALQVASQVDSRTILDSAGAEKLLGNGDMLFLAGDTARPRRIQGAYVAEQEVRRVVEFVRESAEAPEYDEEIVETKAHGNAQKEEDAIGDDDPIYEEARALVVQTQKASASYLQRRFRVGYARAARLLDLMEQNGVVGPADGAKPRDVFIKTADMQGLDAPPRA
ncbi:MAG: hypothetical protein HY472_00475 [Candidatus Sungbacteria bacterium]|nr:hypothetical protein [Candidatus Sungbacteria bacterium]